MQKLHSSLRTKPLLTMDASKERGNTITVTVDPNGTIEDVKKKIQENENISTEQQSLTFAGSVLPLYSRLSNMAENSLLHLTVHEADEVAKEPINIPGNLYRNITILANQAAVLNGNDFINGASLGKVQIASHSFQDIKISTEGQETGSVKVQNGDRIGGASFF
jgi:hypothetical protein